MRRAKRQCVEKKRVPVEPVQCCAEAHSHATEQSRADRHEAKHFSEKARLA
jgi:hypothetical protein